MTDDTSPLTVYYDGGCPLCTAEVALYRKSAGAKDLTFVDVSALDHGTLAPDLDRDDALKRFHVRLSDGRLASGAEGFGRLWLALPAWRWLGHIVLLPGMLQLTEAAYRSFLVIRPALQRFWRAKMSARELR